MRRDKWEKSPPRAELLNRLADAATVDSRCRQSVHREFEAQRLREESWQEEGKNLAKHVIMPQSSWNLMWSEAARIGCVPGSGRILSSGAGMDLKSQVTRLGNGGVGSYFLRGAGPTKRSRSVREIMEPLQDAKRMRTMHSLPFARMPASPLISPGLRELEGTCSSSPLAHGEGAFGTTDMSPSPLHKSEFVTCNLQDGFDLMSLSAGGKPTGRQQQSQILQQRNDIKRRSRRNRMAGNEAGKLYQCKYGGCTKRYKTREGLNLHVRNHHSLEKKWQCLSPGCGKSFVRQADCRLHILRMHCDEKPFPCPTEGCKKSFACQSELKRHLGSHKRNQDKQKRKEENDGPS